MAKQFVSGADYTFGGKHYRKGKPIPADVVERYGPTQVREVGAAAGAAADTDEGDAPNYGRMTVAQLTAELEGRGIEVPTGAKKADLVALLGADDEGDEGE